MGKIICILPVAGMGKRLQPHTFTIPKVLLPVGGKPILGHLIEFIKSLEIKTIIFVIGHLGEKIVNYVKKDFPEIDSIFVRQKDFLGLGYAISLTKKYVDSPVFINLGDTLIEADVKKYLSKNKSWVAVKKVNDPKRFGVAVIDKNGLIKKVVEKPKDFVSDKAICGMYFFKNSKLLFQCLDEIIKKDVKTAGEYQLTDAIQKMIEKGEKIFIYEIDKWFDSGKIESLLETNHYFLEKNKPSYNQVFSVVINPPVYISPDAELRNCVIGPYVSIGKGVSLSNVIVRNSIINDKAIIKNVVLQNSVIGYSAHLIGNLQAINLGDSSVVNLTGEEETSTL
ncbi:MAG: sugar phosphate nucleotidyltransferase [Actinobacteria bacterium]|nr:sugar phosphate nucleotidyltransferase [Actinomycetota bacterium]MCL5674205.1 sugar phosphate nucleotidyltransferase [Candidatus Omnitrophota bacterium]